MEIVALEDRMAAIEAYELAQATGSARTVVHLATPSHEAVRLGIRDARAEHGVFLAAVVPQTGPGEQDLQLSGLAPARPRVARVRKNGTGTLVDVDEATVRMLGWPAEQLVGPSPAPSSVPLT